MTVTPGKFRSDLETVLAMGYTPVLPRELAAGDALPEKPILITFDDGYRSNYDLVYPILREYGVKACISIIVLMPDLPTDNFCTWNQLREMTASGLVEIGSHSYRLHNLGSDGGNFESGGANGVERRPNESDTDFQTRVLDDIQLSHDRIAGELGGVTCFAYPFGCSDPDAKIIFIGPCTAKKQERLREGLDQDVDCVLTFEELQALIDSRDLELSSLPEDVLDNASYYGRIFARSGGLSDAVAQALKEQQIDFPLKPVACDGIEQCRVALLKLNKGVLPENFIEGMACIGGCIGGAGCLTHEQRDKAEVDKYGREAMEKTISDALSAL